MSIMPSGLNLANNSLQGNLPIPPDIIEVFDLSHNQFSGSIPTQMGERLLNSKYVSFSANQLTGAIPPMFCDGNNVLMNLDLSQNNFTGTIPSTFGNCTALVALNLGENNLTGNVPLELENAKNLKAIRLNNNCLTGVFPKPIQNLKDLEFLNLGYNFFEGSIPLFIGHLSGLRVLVLRSNSFNGSIPTEITQMHQLQFMDLSNNNLEGTIPSNLSSFEALTKQTPAVILGYMIELEALSMNLELVNKGMQLQLTKVYSYYTGIDLSNNHLDGAIPEQIGLLQELFMLNLSRNNLVGQIPRSIGNLTTLGSLDISHNKLSGNIPISLTTLDSLGWVSVSFNNLSGQVPSSPHFETLTLDSSVFEGNPLLCGGSTGKSCNTYHEEGVRGQETEGRRTTWLWYGWLVLSFAIGFWGVFVVLAIKETWWVKYWNTMEDMAVGIMNFFSGYKREVKMQRRHDPLL
ncbi:LRR receptor-like serine/threonine-protein kinase GSO1 [Amborella trichopoda]|nr:LRR receptor-like serine/threonine-protein kinase GSO1 [Amborella trichopoda]|eukprot:XP_011621704.2 LRR receptor-like serine/threonine-protein kinase GSO1 [Amborella trichopoda]